MRTDDLNGNNRYLKYQATIFNVYLYTNQCQMENVIKIA